MAASKYKAFISYKHSELGRRHAIALETGLKRYAKPLLQRPIKIFRDEKHMVPDNDLSSLITNGLDQSEFMIFIAEKGAANSPWCQDELEYWCGTLHRKDRLIFVHAADDLKLDIENKSIAWDQTEALPALLKTYISTIPFYVDLTWAQKKEEQTLDHVRFKSAINLITARLRGVAPEELNDVELQVYRRNRRLRNWAIAVLSVMLIISIFASWFARMQTLEAQTQRENAVYQEGIAKDSAASAQKQRSIAEEQTIIAQIQRDTAKIERNKARIAQKEAELQRDIAISGQLAALAGDELEVDPSVSLAFAIKAMQLKPTHQARQMLQTAFLESHVYKILKGHSATINNVQFLENSTQVFSIGMDGQGFIWDADTATPLHQIEGYRGVVSPDEKFVLTNVKDHEVALWNLKNGKREAIFSGHTEPVFALAISNDNTLLASGSSDKTVRIYDRESEKIIGEPIAVNGSVSDLEFSPNGHYLAMGMIYNKIIIWDIAKQAILLKTKGMSIAFSANGETLATGGADDSGIRIIDLKKRKETHHFATEMGSISNLAFSPDGKLLASASSNRDAQIWTNKGQSVSVLSGHTNWVESVAWSPDGQFVVTGSSDLTARVWSVNSGRSVAVLRGHKGGVPVAKFSAEGARIITGSADGTVRMWDLTGAIPEMVTRGTRRSVQQVQFLDDGEHAILAGDDGITQIWDLKSDRIVKELPGDIFSVSPDGKVLATAGAKMDIQLWALPDGVFRKKFNGHDDFVSDLAFSPDGNFLVSASEDKTAVVHALAQPTSNKKVLQHNDGLSGVVFSPNGQYLVSSDYGNMAHLWRWPALSEKAKMPHEDRVLVTSFSHSGHLLATGSGDGTVGIWEMPSGKLKWRLQTGEKDVYTLAFHPNDGRLFIAGSTGNIEAWDLKTGRLLSTFFGHSDGIYKIVISPEGKYMLSASNDYTVWMWDLNTGNPISTFAAHGNAVWSVALSADGQKIITGSEDASAYIYPCEVCLPDDELMAKALDRLNSAPPEDTIINEVMGGLKY